MTVYQAIWILSVKITISQNLSILIWILNLRNAHVRGHAHVPLRKVRIFSGAHIFPKHFYFDLDKGADSK